MNVLMATEEKHKYFDLEQYVTKVVGLGWHMFSSSTLCPTNLKLLTNSGIDTKNEYYHIFAELDSSTKKLHFIILAINGIYEYTDEKLRHIKYAEIKRVICHNSKIYAVVYEPIDTDETNLNNFPIIINTITINTEDTIYKTLKERVMPDTVFYKQKSKKSQDYEPWIWLAIFSAGVATIAYALKS